MRQECAWEDIPGFDAKHSRRTWSMMRGIFSLYYHFYWSSGFSNYSLFFFKWIMSIDTLTHNLALFTFWCQYPSFSWRIEWIIIKDRKSGKVIIKLKSFHVSCLSWVFKFQKILLIHVPCSVFTILSVKMHILERWGSSLSTENTICVCIYVNICVCI